MVRVSFAGISRNSLVLAVTNGSVQDVKDETKRIIDHLAPGGGYILSPGHPVLQDEVPVDNIIAMYETAYEYGTY